MSDRYDRWRDPAEPSWAAEPTTEWHPQFPGQRYPGDIGIEYLTPPAPRGRAAVVGRAEVQPVSPDPAGPGEAYPVSPAPGDRRGTNPVSPAPGDRRGTNPVSPAAADGRGTYPVSPAAGDPGGTYPVSPAARPTATPAGTTSARPSGRCPHCSTSPPAVDTSPAPSAVPTVRAAPGWRR